MTARDFRLAALRIARRFVGFRESGNNWGEFVRPILRNAGISVPAPWCAAFVQWCSDLAAEALNVANPLDDVPNPALVRSYVTLATQRGWITKDPQPGDLFAWVNSDGSGHIGFVERVYADGTITTVEGNTNGAGSREGDGVYRRTRRPTASYVFIRYG